jgi:hypothetical protein
MKYISEENKVSNVDKKNKENLKFNKLGNLITNDNELVFSSETHIFIDDFNKQTKYQVLTHNNKPYDPYGIDSHREKNLDLKLKNVNKDTFEYYLRYLQSKNSLYMTRAQRSFINV